MICVEILGFIAVPFDLIPNEQGHGPTHHRALGRITVMMFAVCLFLCMCVGGDKQGGHVTENFPSCHQAGGNVPVTKMFF